MRNASITHAYRIPAILALLTIAAILAFTTIMTVSAQAEAPDWKNAPTGLNVMAGDQPGEVSITWDPHPQTSKTLSDYRVTWKPDGTAFQPKDQSRWNTYPTTNEVSLTGLDAGATYQVKVRARYDDGKISRWSDIISGQAGVTPNSPATGQPTIAGTAEVGETLTAGTSAIADDNGLTNAVFSHQWVRSTSGSDANITDATDPTYVVTDADADKAIKVSVSFTDDDGYSETLTSDATTSVPQIPTTDDGYGNTVPHNGSIKPSGLVVGDEFRLIFLSSIKRSATSSNIDDYNTFVQNLAAAGHAEIQAYSSGFTAVGCTADDDARDNTDTTYTSSEKGVPIYWLSGNKVANDYDDFYDGSWNNEANNKNESGNNGPDTSLSSNYPRTGCKHDGTEAFPGSGTVSAALGEASVTIGVPNSIYATDGPISSNATVNKSSSRPMYGLSAVLTVVEGPDTRLSDLTIMGTTNGESVTLSPSFASDTFRYDAAVANGIDAVTLSATPSENDASINITDNSDTRTPDTGELDLVVGDNTLTVTVTVAGGGSQTYTVMVTRDIFRLEPTEVPDTLSLIPSGMSVGDEFRLIFLSSTKRSATSSNIDAYNKFVQDLAANGHDDIQAYSDGFRAVGCTTDDDARDNTFTNYTSTNKGVPIYWVNGSKVAAARLPTSTRPVPGLLRRFLGRRSQPQERIRQQRTGYIPRHGAPLDWL